MAMVAASFLLDCLLTITAVVGFLFNVYTLVSVLLTKQVIFSHYVVCTINSYTDLGSLICNTHVKISGIFYHLEFTWNQYWSFGNPKNCDFNHLSSSELWIFGNYWHFKYEIFTKIKIFQAQSERGSRRLPRERSSEISKNGHKNSFLHTSEWK